MRFQLHFCYFKAIGCAADALCCFCRGGREGVKWRNQQRRRPETDGAPCRAVRGGSGSRNPGFPCRCRAGRLAWRVAASAVSAGETRDRPAPAFACVTGTACGRPARQANAFRFWTEQRRLTWARAPRRPRQVGGEQWFSRALPPPPDRLPDQTRRSGQRNAERMDGCVCDTTLV